MKPLHVLMLVSIMAFSFSTKAADNNQSLAVYTPVLSKEFLQLLRNADAEKGKAYFDRKCVNCHDGEKDGGHSTGPHLWNIMGKKSGSAKDFEEYSDAMRNSGHTWNFATLNHYLTRTDRAVPGRLMNFRGIRKDALRANLLAYLRTLHDKPPALP